MNDRKKTFTGRQAVATRVPLKYCAPFTRAIVFPRFVPRGENRARMHDVSIQN